MKMVMVVVPVNSLDNVLDALVNAGFTATYGKTKGGMLQQSQYSLFIAVKDEQVNTILQIVKDICRDCVEMEADHSEVELGDTQTQITANFGGAVAFIWDINEVVTF